MAVIYLRSTDGSDADTGATWALAKATLAGAYAAMAAGDTCWVSQAHSEARGSAMALTSPGTPAAPCRVICVQDGGGTPTEPPTTLAATAVIRTAGNYALTHTGSSYFYGITFQCGVGGTISVGSTWGSSSISIFMVFDTCRIENMTTSGTARMYFLTGTNKDARVDLINTVIKLGSSGQRVISRHNLNWIGGSLDVSTAIPAALFLGDTGHVGRVTVRGVDLSGLNTALVLAGGTGANGSGKFRFMECKLHASVIPLSATTAIVGQGGEEVTVDNCDSGDTNYKIDHRKYEGSIVTEIVIIRTGGASDGTTGYSWKIVSLATPQFWAPLQSPPIAIWNETVGSAKTLTVEIVHDSVTNLKDDEVWVEVEYLGTAGFPITTRITDRKADILATAADQTASTVAWTTTGLTNPNKQKLSVTFTPQEKGPFVARVMLAKASYTVYVCPKVTVA